MSGKGVGQRDNWSGHRDIAPDKDQNKFNWPRVCDVFFCSWSGWSIAL